jgi:hypothetical protein
MVRWSIDDTLEGMSGDHIRVVNLLHRVKNPGIRTIVTKTYEDTPKVHKHKKTEIKPSVQRKYEDEQMIGRRLQVTIEGMKCVGGEGSWNCGGR